MGFRVVSVVVHLLPVHPREEEAEIRHSKKVSYLQKQYVYSILCELHAQASLLMWTNIRIKQYKQIAQEKGKCTHILLLSLLESLVAQATSIREKKVGSWLRCWAGVSSQSEQKKKARPVVL